MLLNLPANVVTVRIDVKDWPCYQASDNQCSDSTLQLQGTVWLWLGSAKEQTASPAVHTDDRTGPGVGRSNWLVNIWYPVRAYAPWDRDPNTYPVNQAFGSEISVVHREDLAQHRLSTAQ